MKKIYLFLLSIVFMTACEKSKDLKYQNEDDAAKRGGGNGKECLLTNISSEYGTEAFEYNRKDLLSKWTLVYPGYEGYFIIDRDYWGRMVKAHFYDLSGTLLNNIKFTYRGKEIIKDTWYDPATNEIVDEVVYTHNRRGKITKGVSELGDYYVLYTYTSDGDNLKRWKYFVAGVPVFQGDYTYLNPYKNPTSAVRGLDYEFPFINAPYNTNKLYSTSEKSTYFDENGNPVVDSDQDPYQTIATANSKNYVATSDFYNILSNDWVHFNFTYENCGYCKSCNTKSTGETAGTRMATKQFGPGKLILRGSAASIREKVKNYRKALTN